MKKKKYIAPQTVMIETDVTLQILAGSDQPNHTGAKQNIPYESETWEDDNPWERVAHPHDLWE